MLQYDFFFGNHTNNLGWKGSQSHVVQPFRWRLEFIAVICSGSTVPFHPRRDRLSTQNWKKKSALSQFETHLVLQSLSKLNLNLDVYVKAWFRYFQIIGICLRLLRWLIYLPWVLQLSFSVLTSLIFFFWYTLNKYYMYYSRIQISGFPCKENK